MDIDEARRFLERNHRAVLCTFRGDGRPQLSAVMAVVDGEGSVAISSRETAYKVRNLRRDPRASICVLSDDFSSWIQVEGSATIVSLPDAMEALVDYYRRAAGEHPDWDDYRAAMEREQRVVVSVPIERAGPNRWG